MDMYTNLIDELCKHESGYPCKHIDIGKENASPSDGPRGSVYNNTGGHYMFFRGVKLAAMPV